MPIYMHYDGIKGQVNASAGSGGQIEVESFSWGESQKATQVDYFDGRLLTGNDLAREQDAAETGGRLRTSLSDLSVVMQIDKAEPGNHAGLVNVCFGDGSVRFDPSGQGDLIW